MLTVFQDENENLMQVQRNWKSKLDPLLSKPLLNGRMLTNVALNNGSTTIPHGLTGTQQGWILVDVAGAATIFRSAPFNNKNLVLTSSAAVTVSLWVF